MYLNIMKINKTIPSVIKIDYGSKNEFISFLIDLITKKKNNDKQLIIRSKNICLKNFLKNSNILLNYYFYYFYIICLILVLVLFKLNIFYLFSYYF